MRVVFSGNITSKESQTLIERKREKNKEITFHEALLSCNTTMQAYVL